jgi:hypothetical protein
MMEESLIALLLADPGVAAVAGDRVHWLRRPQGEATPALVLSRVGGGHAFTYGGRDDLVEARVQIDAWAERLADVKALARAVNALLSGYRATSGSIRSAFLNAERDGLQDADPFGTLARVSLDFTIWHQENTL